MVSDGGIYLFGGADSESRTNDLFIFEIGKIIITVYDTLRSKEMDKDQDKRHYFTCCKIGHPECLAGREDLLLRRLHEERGRVF